MAAAAIQEYLDKHKLNDMVQKALNVVIKQVRPAHAHSRPSAATDSALPYVPAPGGSSSCTRGRVLEDVEKLEKG